MRNTFLMALMVMIFLGCKKEITKQDCAKLKEAMAGNNISNTQAEITSFINRLSSNNYSEQNLTKLTEFIFNHCAINASLLCFDCIHTLPAQSEIRLSYTSGGSVISKTIDISQDQSNKIIFLNMHD